MGWFEDLKASLEEAKSSLLSEAKQKEWRRWVEEHVEVPDEARTKIKEVQSNIKDVTNNYTGLFVCSCTISFLLGFKAGRIQPTWRRLTNVSDIPSSYFGDKAPMLRGRVVSVSDGDTIRFLHKPTVFHSSKLSSFPENKVSDFTLPLRICTIDTPEVAKFGKPGQPFGEEAKTYLANLVDEKIVRVRLLTRDQYGRAVAEVLAGRFWPFTKYADEYMLKAGLAEVYEGSGAVYGPRGKEHYLKLQGNAQQAKKGIWSQQDRESAAQFKARPRPFYGTVTSGRLRACPFAVESIQCKKNSLAHGVAWF
eukprot:g4540.t1